MRILLTSATTFYGGGERFIFELARGLQQRAHHPVVASEPGELLLRKCASAGIETAPVRFRRSVASLATVATLRGIIRARGIDLLHSNAARDRTVASFAARATRVPHIASVHSQRSIQHNPTHWARNRLGIDRFLVDGERARRTLVALDRIDARRIGVIPLGLDPPVGDRRAIRERTRAELGIPLDAIVIGNVARAVPFKGTTHLVAAAAGLCATNPNLHVVLVGDGALLNDLRAQAARLGLEGRAHFLGFRDDLDRLYPAFDIYAQPSLDTGGESFPLAVVQALAAGIPVVVTSIGEMPQMVDGGACGLVCAAGNADDLAAKLASLVTDSAVRVRMSTAARNFAREKASCAGMIDGVERNYYEVAEQARRA